MADAREEVGKRALGCGLESRGICLKGPADGERTVAKKLTCLSGIQLIRK